ncbi:hypothetical protein CDAR_16771 [Caerostris darwini]|uniref:Uncharacterized protein n=1 Tax=Caerostris darwini TaxID=1538125 RepID=A0AAV4M7K9_9ARAC|nr:hypothetical protein CDAR_16771 [Caerostris darwini]
MENSRGPGKPPKLLSSQKITISHLQQITGPSVYFQLGVTTAQSITCQQRYIVITSFKSLISSHGRTDEFGYVTKSLGETMQKIIKHHFTFNESTSQTELEHHIPKDSLNVLEFREFTRYEIEGVISKLKPNKSPGPDAIPGELVKDVLRK